MITNLQLPLPSRSPASFLRKVCFAGAIALACLAGGPAQSQTTFTPGVVFAGENDPNALARVPLASEGGTQVTAFASFPASNAGQIAWSQDLTTAYATVYSADSVIRFSPTGIASGFATVSGATGIAVLPDGRVLCGSYNTNQILDITAGGAGPFPVYASVSGPRNLLVTSTGTLFAVSQNNQQIQDLTVPGSPVVFATLPSSTTEVIELADGRILASVYGNSTVVDITAGGTFLAGQSVFASERGFMGLAQDATGRILANVLGVTGIWDITNGGNFGSVAATYTTAGRGESMLDSVPGVSMATFAYTGAAQTFTVPAGVTSIHIQAWGAQGFTVSNPGGQGGFASGDLAVTPGEQLQVMVGGQGTASIGDQIPGGGGFNGGGHGMNNGSSSDWVGGGGGASDLRQGGSTLGNRVIVAGGGGGATSNDSCFGGAGGGLVGENGGSSYPGGTGGGQTEGGTVGGELGQGGSGIPGTTTPWNGGGGGGYYGGGTSMEHAGGGGGSGYTGGVTNGVNTRGGRAGDGHVVITYTAGPPETTPLLPANLVLSRVPRFMPTLVGRQSRPLPVRATNRGEEPLRILSVRFSGKAAREFRILRSGANTIQPGATVVVRAVFAPRRSGARRAVLTVRSTGGTMTAKVSGRGRPGGSPLTRYPLRPHPPR